MKKILAGMFFRLVRGYEIWALIGLFLFATIYLTHTDVMTLDYLSAKYTPGYTYSYDYGEGETVISKDNADLYRYEFTHIVVTAANHPSLSVEEYKKLLATSSGSGRRWTYRRISFVDKIYDYVSMGILPMVQHKRKDLPPEYTSFISMLRERLARTDLSSRTIENYVDAVWSFCAYMAAQNVLSFKNITEVQMVRRAAVPSPAGYGTPSGSV